MEIYDILTTSSAINKFNTYDKICQSKVCAVHLKTHQKEEIYQLTMFAKIKRNVATFKVHGLADMPHFWSLK